MQSSTELKLVISNIIQLVNPLGLLEALILRGAWSISAVHKGDCPYSTYSSCRGSNSRYDYE